MKRFERRFTGKSVALVGPAPHILDRVQDLSGFDYVVRTNTAIAMPPEVVAATGPRCDVLYLAVFKGWMRKASAMARVQEFRVKNTQLWHSTPQIHDVLMPWKDRVSIIDSDMERWLTAQVGCDPNVGLIAMVDILHERPSRLYLTGFTFFQGVSHYPGYRNGVFSESLTKTKGETPLHRQQPQFDFFLEHIRPLVEVDDTLNQICEHGLSEPSRSCQC